MSGGVSMQNIYGLGFLRKHQEPYCFPMSLEEIDGLTTTHSKKEILEILRKNDSVVQETDENTLRIFKIKQNKWKESHIEYLEKEQAHLLNYSLEETLSNEKKTSRHLNDLYSHFSPWLKKNFIDEKMKETIRKMKEGKKEFLESFKELSYENQRQIRTYLGRKMEIQPKKKEKNSLEKRVVNQKEEYQLKYKKAS